MQLKNDSSARNGEYARKETNYFESDGGQQAQN
jgi:hypothetical protein